MPRSHFTVAGLVVFIIASRAFALDFVPDQSLLPTQGAAFTDNVVYYSPIGEVFTASTISLNVVALDVILYETSASAIVRVQIYQGIGGPLVATSSDVLIPPDFNAAGILMTEFFFPQAVSLTPGLDYFISLNQPDPIPATFLGGNLGPGPYNRGVRAGSLMDADYYFAEGTSSSVPEPSAPVLLAVATGLLLFWRRRSAGQRQA